MIEPQNIETYPTHTFHMISPRHIFFTVFPEVDRRVDSGCEFGGFPCSYTKGGKKSM